jgi:CDP-diacylglycerol--inositol 3-phosphatidyltransferase
MAPQAGARGGGPWLLSQHDKIHLYVPNLIGAYPARIPGRIFFLSVREGPAAAPRRPCLLPRARLRARSVLPPLLNASGPDPQTTITKTGYARVALALAAYCVSLRHPLRTVLLYFLSFVCDELDGRAARAFGQSSTLGAVLDMVTDRVATACLLAIVGALYGAACPAALLCALMLVALDVSSHWFGMYASLRCGEASHKDAKQHRALLVRLYYRHRLFMGACCVACEVLYLSLYLLAWPEQFGVGGTRSWAVPLPKWGAALLWRVAGPQSAGAASSSLPGGLAAALQLAARRREVPLAAVVALLSVPLWLTKQVCNWLQLRSAMDRLVEWDLAARRRERGGGRKGGASSGGGGGCNGGAGGGDGGKGGGAAAAAAGGASPDRRRRRGVEEDEQEEAYGQEQQRQQAANGSSIRGRSRGRGVGGGVGGVGSGGASSAPARRR